MKVFAISDLHLSTAQKKPMDIFGDNWVGYFDNIKEDWKSKVAEDDLVLLPGDFSWAMRMDDASQDFAAVSDLPGKKILLRGNHDYWWSTLSKVRASLPSGFFVVQNDCLRFENVLICGSRGWLCPDKGALAEDDRKIYLREIERLRLSLTAMSREKREGDTVVCMMHFPPFNARQEPSGFTDLLTEFGIKTVVFGHLHGRENRQSLHFCRFGIDFYLTSTDLAGHKLTHILP